MLLIEDGFLHKRRLMRRKGMEVVKWQSRKIGPNCMEEHVGVERLR